ncbi:MAG: IS3 family transposase [Solidesulfovibrio sp. DCME]|uniref:IS3 family transposase n=1 Tax=Solidesulfovibrio sp. DCME TaxID=3447380 RepID=UPI003D11635B
MNLDLMRRIDEQFLETPFYGSRQMRRHLRHQGIEIGRGRVRRLMRKMGLMAIYQKPKTSQPHPGHKIGHVRQRGVNSGVLEVALGQAALGGIWAGCASFGWVLSSAMASTCM